MTEPVEPIVEEIATRAEQMVGLLRGLKITEAGATFSSAITGFVDLVLPSNERVRFLETMIAVLLKRLNERRQTLQ